MSRPETATPLAKIDLARLLSEDSKRSGEMEATWQYILEEDKKLPDQSGMSMEGTRQIAALRNKRWNNGKPDVASVKRLTIPGLGGDGDILCDLYTPVDASPGCLVYLHGGGWANGSIESHTRIPRTLANQLGVPVLNVEYRLAPEHPFPAGLNDCVAALHWVREQAETQPAFQGVISISGDSAGANLAVATMLHEIRARKPLPECGLLFYGVYDCDFDTPSYQRFGVGHGLMRAGMEKFLDMYAPGGTGPDALRYDPLISPVQASEALLARLPPLYLNAAGLDPLLCDTVKFANRLEEAGVQFDINVHEGVHHGFMQITERLDEARTAYEMAEAFYRSVAGT